MDEEIILDRGNTTVMKLDADEQALMDEIEISAPRPKPVPRPVQHMHRPAPQQHQEAMDAFVNPNKQTAPSNPSKMRRLIMGRNSMMMNPWVLVPRKSSHPRDTHP